MHQMDLLLLWGHFLHVSDFQQCEHWLLTNMVYTVLKGALHIIHPIYLLEVGRGTSCVTKQDMGSGIHELVIKKLFAYQHSVVTVGNCIHQNRVTFESEIISRVTQHSFWIFFRDVWSFLQFFLVKFCFCSVSLFKDIYSIISFKDIYIIISFLRFLNWKLISLNC